MRDWYHTCLAALIDIKHGFAFKGEFFSDGPFGDILVTPGNFSIGGGFQLNKPKYYVGPVADEYVLNAGDVIVTMTDLSKNADTLGYSAIVPTSEMRFLHNQRIGKVIAKSDEVFLPFIAWVMRTSRYRNEILGGATGSTVKHTSPGRILSYKFKLPPRSVQRGIASILGALDDKIELNRRMNETLEAMARAIFKDWFVDFGPTRAKAEGRVPYLSEKLWSLFPDRLDNDGRPEGWRPDKLGNICSRVAIGPFGSSITTDNFVDHGVPVIRGGNLKAGFIDSEFVYLTNEKAEELKNAIALPQDIVITHRGTLGQVGIIPNGARFQKYIISQSQMLLRIDDSKASPRFAFEFLRSNVGMQQLLAFTSQTGVPAIARPTTSLKSLEIIMPNRIVISKFDQIIAPIIEMESRNISESRTLAQTRDLLLPKLMSGEIRVRDAETLVENAL